MTQPNQVGNLTERFLEEVKKASEDRRILLLLDGYEQVADSKWLPDFARAISGDVLLVMAGRRLREDDRDWKEYGVEVIEVGRMDDKAMRYLINAFCKRRGQEITPRELSSIIRLSDQFPLWATFALGDAAQQCY